MSKLKIVGGTKYKKKIIPKYYNDSENLFNILIGTLDIIWKEAFKDTEDNFDGKDTFDDSAIGTTSLTELYDIPSNEQRKKKIEDLINNGKSDMERKFLIFPKNSVQKDGLLISCKIEATFDINNEEFDYDITVDTDIAEDSKEKYKFLRQRFIEKTIIFNTYNINELYNYIMEQTEKYLEEFDKDHKPDA